MDIFLLVVSMWGFTGEEWVYVGNQIVLNMEMSEGACEDLAKSWSWWQGNEFYRFSVECVLKGNIT